MNHRPLLRDHVLLGLLCGLLFFPFLGSSVLWDFDEGYFASIAKEMYEKGEWIVPTFSERELGDKPILIFWGMILSFSIFGVSEFAVRFPTALYGTATVFLTYHLARRLFQATSKNSAEEPGPVVPVRPNEVALRSAFILATMLLFVVETRGTTCDGAMICWIVAALTVYVFGCRGFRKDFVETPCESFKERIAPWFPDRWIVVVLMNACFGMAVLAKGPAMFVMGTAVLGLFLLVKAFPGRIRRNPLTWIVAFLKICWQMRPLTAVFTVLLVAGPWFLAVGWKTDWEWTNMFFVEHHYQRSVEATRGHTGFGLSLLFYPITSLFGIFPWSVFLVPWLLDLFRRLRRGSEPKNAYCFVVCWIVLYFGFFSLVSTKLPHYVVPAYPALAITLGAYLVHWRQGNDLVGRFWTPAVIGTLILVGGGLTITMYLVLPKYFPNEQLTGVAIGLVPLCAGIIGSVAYRWGGRKAFDVVYLLLALIFAPMLFQWAASDISEHAFHDQEFFHDIAPGANGVPPLIVCIGMDEPSWIFYSGQPMRKITIRTLRECKPRNNNDPAVLVQRLRDTLAELDQQRPKYLLRFTDRRLAEGRLFFIVGEPDYEKYVQPLFGDTLKEVDRMRRFMRKYDQLLLEVNSEQ